MISVKGQIKRTVMGLLADTDYRQETAGVIQTALNQAGCGKRTEMNRLTGDTSRHYHHALFEKGSMMVNAIAQSKKETEVDVIWRRMEN